ncbi:hypothetical protein GCM10027053_48970 [Intrasporangium mesophilum]
MVGRAWATSGGRSDRVGSELQAVSARVARTPAPSTASVRDPTHRTAYGPTGDDPTAYERGAAAPRGDAPVLVLVSIVTLNA